MPVNITGYNERLQQVVDTVLSPTYFRTPEKEFRHGRSTLTDRRGGSSESYSGYFKIIDASTTGNGTTTRKIRVVDGATYDPETGSSGPSVCKVNHQVFSVEPVEFTVSASKVYVLKFTAESVESEGSPAKVEVVEVNALPSDDSDYAWYQIGRVIVDDDSMTIQQDHTAGVAQMFWYLLCGEV